MNNLKSSLLGLYGGTFDPIHLGHLQIAKELQEIVKFQQLYFIPSGSPRLRDAPAATMVQRAEMVGLAIQGIPEFVLDEREIHRTGISATVDTLREYRAERKANEAICFILGMDAFMKLPHWQDWQALFTLCHFIIVNRPGYQSVDEGLPAALQAACKNRWVKQAHDLAYQQSGLIFNAPTSLLDISATEIRAFIANGESVEQLLTEEVAAYIQENNIYAGEV